MFKRAINDRYQKSNDPIYGAYLVEREREREREKGRRKIDRVVGRNGHGDVSARG